MPLTPRGVTEVPTISIGRERSQDVDRFCWLPEPSSVRLAPGFWGTPPVEQEREDKTCDDIAEDDDAGCVSFAEGKHPYGQDTPGPPMPIATASRVRCGAIRSAIIVAPRKPPSWRRALSQSGFESLVRRPAKTKLAKNAANVAATSLMPDLTTAIRVHR
jgi:hypothetical protein